MRQSPKHILVFTRWENVYFRLSLGRKLKAVFPEATLTFATILKWTHEQVLEAGENSVYLLGEMEKLTGDELSPERIAEIDRDLYEHTGAGLNLMVLSERGKPKTGRGVEKMRYRHLVVLDRLISEDTLTIHETCDSYVYWLAGGLAITRGGWNFGFISCGIPSNTVLALRTAWTCWRGSGKLAPAVTLAEQRALLAEPVEKRMGYMNQKPPRSPINWLKYQWMVLRYCLIDAKHGAYYYGFKDYLPSLASKTWRIAKRRLPVPVTLRTAAEVENLDTPFVYFPMQMEPEASIFGYSPWFHSQLEALRLICQSMPVGWKILVKENPKMRGARPLGYYRKVLGLPNVELVDIKVPTFPLLTHCRAVAALSGTATFEGRILGKPTFCFGSPPFHNMVTDSDVAGRSRMRDWFRKMSEENPEPLSEAAFEEWKRGTFEARGSMFWQGSYRGLDASDTNVDKYLAFILDVLEKPRFNTVP